jgi:hypothetical protein
MVVGAALIGVPGIDAPVRSGASAPEDAALLVGIEDYAFLPDVPWVRRDLAAMNDLLVHTRGVPQEHVVRLDGASLDQMKAGLDRALASKGPGGTLWVYFAGHGAADPATGALLLVGDDAKADASVFAARGWAVESLIASLPDGSVVVLDTCWAGAARTGDPLVPGSRFAVPTTALRARPQVTVWTAASPAEVASAYDPAEHGAFTYFVIGALRGWADGELSGSRDGQVDLDEARAWVGRAMSATGVSGQAPVFAGAEVAKVTVGALEPAPEIAAFPPASARRPANAVIGALAPTSTVPNALRDAGYLAPIRRIDNKRWADAQDRTLGFWQIYGSLAGDLEGEAIAKEYRKTERATTIGGIVALTSFTLGASAAWLPFLLDEPELGWQLTGASAGVTALGIGIAVGNQHRVRKAQDEVVDAVNERLAP